MIQYFILDKEKRALSLGALAESSNLLHPAIELNQLLFVLIHVITILLFSSM